MLKEFLNSLDIRLADENHYGIFFRNRTDKLIEFGQLSSGEKDLITMVFPIIEGRIEQRLAVAKNEKIRQGDIVLLIDGPETYLHPSLELNFLKYLRDSVEKAQKENSRVQFVLCTHSQVIINNALPSELYLLSFPAKGADNQLLCTDKLNRKSLQSLLGDLGFGVISAGKTIILFEGEEDIQIIQIFFPDIEHEFILLPLGGKGKILKMVRTFRQVISELNSMNISIFAVLDRDRGRYVKSNMKRLENLIFTYPGLCIENLLIDPDEIFEALKILVTQNKLTNMNIGSGNDVKELINRIIRKDDFFNNELKQRVQEELIFHIDIKDHIDISFREIEIEIDEIATKKKNRLRKITEEKKKEIREAVNAGKLENLNGKVLFGMIAKEFGLERKTLVRIVADKLREHNRIPKGLKDIIQCLRMNT
jgi:hypothetical protein